MEYLTDIREIIDDSLIAREFEQYFPSHQVKEFIRDFKVIYRLKGDYSYIEEIIQDIDAMYVVYELEHWLSTDQRKEFIDWICKIYGIYDEDEE